MDIPFVFLESFRVVESHRVMLSHIQQGGKKIIGQDHYNDVIMSAMASQITSVSMVCSTVCSGTDQGIHQSSASLAFMRGIHRRPLNSPHKGPVTRKIFSFGDVIMITISLA